MMYINRSTELKPPTGEVNNIDHLVSMASPSGGGTYEAASEHSALEVVVLEAEENVDV